MSVVLPINPDDRYRIVTASAGQTLLAISFPWQDDQDISIYRDNGGDEWTALTIVADYALSGAGSPAGGSATVKQPAVAGEKFLLLGRAVLDRVSSIVRNGKFSSLAIDDEFDRNRIIQQELAREEGRSVKTAYGAASQEMPAPSNGFLLGWVNDHLANLQVLSAGSLLVGTFGAGLVLSDVRADALDALDPSRVSAYGAVGDNLAIDTVPFQNWKAARGANPSIVPPGIYRLANNIDFGGMRFELGQGTRFVSPTGANWDGGIWGAYVGDPFIGIFNNGSPGALSPDFTRIITDHGMLVVNRQTLDPAVAQGPGGWIMHYVYQGKILDNGYKATAAPLSAFLQYGAGMGSDKASGTHGAAALGTHIHRAQNPATGRTELQGSAHYLKALPPHQGGYQGPGMNWWGRETTVTGGIGYKSDGLGGWIEDPDHFDGFLCGDQFLVQKFSPGGVVNGGAAYNGSMVLSLHTRPSTLGFAAGDYNLYRTFPLDVIATLSGYSGASTVGSGYDAAADYGALVALGIGGTRTSIWSGPTSRSKFGKGIVVTDYVFAGLEIFTSHPHAPGLGVTPFAIHTYEDAGIVALRQDVITGTASLHVGAGSDQFHKGIRLYPSKHATSNSTGIDFAGIIEIRADFNGTGANEAGLRHVPGNRTTWYVDAAGYFYLPALPTAASGDRVYKDASGFLKVAP